MMRFMWISPIVALTLLAITTPAWSQAAKKKAAESFPPTQAQRDALRARAAELARLIEAIRSRPPLDPHFPDDALADVAVFHKALVWIDRHDNWPRPNYVALAGLVAEEGINRARFLLDRRRPWLDDPRGRMIAKGYVSKVDGSTQPLAVGVPALPLADGERYRLDVVLHGRDESITEVAFLAKHMNALAPADESGLILHVYGRGNNAFRFAGEADVFEAIDAVKRAFPVDESRILVRGFSMGGAGAWHIGLHHPAKWCAVEAGAGFTDTIKFLKLDETAQLDTVRAAMRIYDATDFALNAFNLPVAAYGGEVDPQLQAAVNIREALEAEGLPLTTEGLVSRGSPPFDFLFVVGAKTAHKIDPASAAILKEFRDTRAAKGRAFDPSRPVRFVTTTLRYPDGPGLKVERLVRQFERATVTITPAADGQSITVAAENVAVLGLDRRWGPTAVFGDRSFPLAGAAEGRLPLVYFARVEDGWDALDYDQSRDLQKRIKVAKAPGLQGPIDDAFLEPFLCVRGTGKPRDPAVQAWADARLSTLSANWNRWLRGDLPIKDDTAVTPEDIESKHLILFGDPGSNLWIERYLPNLPLKWTANEIALGGRAVPAAGHAPALIAPNPTNHFRYVVINSGTTYDADDLEGSNARVYPHEGDFSLYRLDTPKGSLLETGFFDENWTAGNR
jgi:hypothetical protein